MTICVECAHCRSRYEGEYPQLIQRCRHPKRSRQEIIDPVSGQITYEADTYWERWKKYPHCQNQDGKCNLHEPAGMTLRAFWFWFIITITLTVVLSLDVWFWLWMFGVPFCKAGLLMLPCFMVFTLISALWVGWLANRRITEATE